MTDQILKQGLKILDEVMIPHGFASVFTDLRGLGSGGEFSSAVYARVNRRLELHLRFSLGLVAYHLDKISLSHEDYMWSVIGKRHSSNYPGFSDDPLDGFRHLLRDLVEYGSAFLTGTDEEFLRHVEKARQLKLTSS